MDADNAKDTDPEEGPRHFIDFDEYGEYPFPELPEDYDAAVEKYGEVLVVGRGIVPWQVERTYLKLVDAFKQRDKTAVLKHSAWLGHYVGDAHVPLHTTSNYDGQMTGQTSLHSYFESRMLNELVSPGGINPEQGQRLDGPKHALAFEWARESFQDVQPILDADRDNRDAHGKRDLQGFAEVAKPIAVVRLTAGASRLASLWYTAWLDAGEVEIS